MDPAVISAGLNFVSGLFGKKEKYHPPSENIMSLAEGVTDAQKKFGINRLTLLRDGGGPVSSVSPGSPPPLASLSVLADLVDDKYGQDAKDRREHNRLQNELLTLEVERARTLRTVAPGLPSAGGGAITGGRVQTRTGSFSDSGSDRDDAVFGAPGSEDQRWMTPGRADNVKPQEHGSGVLHYDNALTGPITLLGDDGEPFMEYLQVPLFGGFQVMNNWARKIAEDYVVPWAKGDPNWKPPKRKSSVDNAPFGKDRYGRPLPRPTF